MPAISPALLLASRPASHALPAAGSSAGADLAYDASSAGLNDPGTGHATGVADFASLLRGQFAELGQSLANTMAHAAADGNQAIPLAEEPASSSQGVQLSQLSSTHAQLWASLRSTTSTSLTEQATAQVADAEDSTAAPDATPLPTTDALSQHPSLPLAAQPAQDPSAASSELPQHTLPDQVSVTQAQSASAKHHRHAQAHTATPPPVSQQHPSMALLTATAPQSPEQALASERHATSPDPMLATNMSTLAPRLDHGTTEEQERSSDDSAVAAALPWLAPVTPTTPASIGQTPPPSTASDTPPPAGNRLAADHSLTTSLPPLTPTPLASPAPTLPTTSNGNLATAEIAAPVGMADGLTATPVDSSAPSPSQAPTFAQALLATSQATGNAATPTSSTLPPLNTPIQHPGWDQEVAERVVWLAGRQEQRAELVLNPPNLGRIEISLTLQGDQASASFVSPHPIVREALENAMPRLREMFAEAGLSLGQSQVGAESQQQQQASHGTKQGNNPDSPRFFTPDGDNDRINMAQTGVLAVSRQGRGLVDTFV